MSKTFPKILIIIFLSVSIFQLAGLIFLLTVPEPAQAGSSLNLQVDIGDTGEIKFDKTTAPIAKYIKAIYKYAIGIVGILATVVMMFGGVLWLTAGGNAERVANAKSWIGAALTGLVLALTSYMILYTINPALVEFKLTEIKSVDEKNGDKNKNKVCCQYENNCASGVTIENCTSEKGTPKEGYTCDNNIKKCVILNSGNSCCQCFPSYSSNTLTACKNNITDTHECYVYCNDINGTWDSKIIPNTKCEDKKCVP